MKCWSAGAVIVLALGPLFVAAPVAQQGPKVLLLYDMEGVTGAVKPSDVNFGSDGYPATRESLTEDVNAAIRGLLKAGAREVVITDGHGSGNPDPDYLLDRLPKGARFDLRSTPYDPYIEAMDGSYAAMAAVAMHSRAGGGGFLAHTYFGHTRWIMGGHDMNESMLVAASAARFNIPLILVTGDEVLQREVAAFSPDTQYVAVKRVLSVEAAEPRPRAAVSAEIETAAERALRTVATIRPWTPASIQAPFENRFSYILPEQAAVAISYPGTTVVDNKTVALRANTFLEAYLAFRALANFTSYATSRLIAGWLRDVEGGADTLRKLQERLPSRAQRTFAPTGNEIERSYSRHGYR